MRRLRKGIDRGLGGQQRRPDQAPLAPAATDPAPREGNRGVVCQGVPDPVEIGTAGARIEMDGNEVADGGQPFGLGDDPVGILVTEKDIGYPRHDRNSCPFSAPIVSLFRIIHHWKADVVLIPAQFGNRSAAG